MRSVSLVLVLILILKGAPAAASTSADPSAFAPPPAWAPASEGTTSGRSPETDEEPRQRRPTVLIRPRPWLPPSRPVLAPLPPLTEDEWSRWLLRARAQASRCARASVISGALAAAGLATAAKHSANPSQEDRLAGRTGKADTFLNTLGAASFIGGGLTFLGSGRCANYARTTVSALELEGRHRGFGPPVPAPLTQQEWMARAGRARTNASTGRWMTMAGATAMLLGGNAMTDHQPPDDRRGPARLGRGIGVFLAGFGSAVTGSVIWAGKAREVRDLERRGPGPAVALQLTPQPKGLRARLVIGF
jgi:hypothetical protein